MHSAKPPCIVGDRCARGSEGLLSLSKMGDANGCLEVSTERLGGPSQDRVPLQPLTLNQSCRAGGTIKRQVRRQIFDDLRSNQSPPLSDAVDDHVDQTGQRHFCWIDRLVLSVPFRGDGSSQCWRWYRERAPRGRQYRFVIEPHRMAFGDRNRRRVDVEPLPQHGPCATPRRIYRVLHETCFRASRGRLSTVTKM